jgi:hypothetical protein
MIKAPKIEPQALLSNNPQQKKKKNTDVVNTGEEI